MNSPKEEKALGSFFSLSLVACLLGNFVDQYDLFLFGAIRVSSLRALGLNEAAILDSGVLLLNCQMAGMLFGGIAAGILGDKLGRVRMLFGSIALYSAANVANAFVADVPQYAVCRFVGGFGLAGEIGACITLILETLPIGLRGYGTMLLMAFGHTAAITCSALARLLDWRTNYLIGGVMGLVVLLLRFKAQEAELFLKQVAQGTRRGNLLRLFESPQSAKRYLAGILVATPTWFAFTILVIFAPELSQSLGLSARIPPERYMPYYFVALVLGDLTGGILGQVFRTRKWIIAGYIAMLGVLTGGYLWSREMSELRFLALISGLGFFSAYTVLSFTVAAEQFGTNVRATAATSTPNFVRASAIVFTTAFGGLKAGLGVVQSAAWIGAVTIALALASALALEETFSKDLDYVS